MWVSRYEELNSSHSSPIAKQKKTLSTLKTEQNTQYLPLLYEI